MAAWSHGEGLVGKDPLLPGRHSSRWGEPAQAVRARADDVTDDIGNDSHGPPLRDSWRIPANSQDTPFSVSVPTLFGGWEGVWNSKHQTSV